MKIAITITFLLVVCTTFGQKPDEVLATATGHTFTTSDLSPEAQDARTKLPLLVANVRSQLFAQTQGSILLETEARTKNVTVAVLIKTEIAKVKAPTEAEIKKVFDANRGVLGGRSIDEVRPQIVEFLRRDPEDKIVKAYVDSLAVKYKVVNGKDVNAVGLKPTDTLFSMTGRTYTVKEFEDANRFSLADVETQFYDDLAAELNEVIYNRLVLDEATAQKIDSSDLIAREITSKMKDYSDAEREDLESGFRKRLFTKYAVKVLLKIPEPLVQSISADDDPANGPANAPVTVVMFNDFQCSACSATHPVLKQVLESYGSKIRFVVRDFPIESLHNNAFRAALAANAANAQGKFFEYTDILYNHQDSLDDVSLKKYAADLGLNAKQFEIDLNSEKAVAKVRKDMADGESYGVNGTPTIFVNGVRVRTLSAEAFRNAIDRALTKK